MMKFSINFYFILFYFGKEQNFVKENIESSRSFLFVKMKISELINHSTYMC